MIHICFYFTINKLNPQFKKKLRLANAATAVSFGRTFNEGASHGSYFLILHGNAAGKWV